MTDLNNLNALSETDFKALTADQITQLSAAAIRALDRTHYQWLMASTISAMTPEQIAALVHIDWLAPAAVSGLSAAQVQSVSIDWVWMSAAWLNALSPDVFAAIPPARLITLASAAVNGLDGAHVGALTLDQLASFTRFSSLSVAGTQALGMEAVHALTPQQFSQLRYTDRISLAIVATLSAAQVSQLYSGSWPYMSAAWLNALSPDAFAAIPADQMDRLPNAAIQGLDAAHVGALTAGQLASFTRIGYLSSTATGGLGADAVSALTPQQIASLSSPQSLSAAAVGALSAAQVAAIGASGWSKVDSAWLGALSGDALRAIPPDAFGRFGAPVLRGLTADSVRGMTAQQFAAVSNPDWIPLSAVPGIRPEQLCLMTDMDSVSARWLNALSPEAFAAIAPAGINQMSLAALQGLDAAHRLIALQGADATHAGYIAMAPSDASLNYDGVLASLSRMASSIGPEGLSVDQFAALNGMLAGAKASNGGQTYVSSLLTSMLKEGVAVDTSADTFNTSVGKWFLGAPNLTASSYTDVSDQALFNGSLQQAAQGVVQGGLGDCGIISALEDLAAVAPERLSGLIGANGNGTYAIKLYDNGTDPFFVTVDSTIANAGASMGGGTWVRLMEDAIAKACAASDLPAMWSSLEGNYSFTTQDALTGDGYRNFDSGADAYAAVAAALEDDSGLVTYSSWKSSTGEDGKTNLVKGHAFAVIGIDATNGDMIFRNPWSSDLVFELSAGELDAIAGGGYFSVTEMSVDYGASAAPRPQAQGDAASIVQAMASFDVPGAAAAACSPLDRPQPAQVGILTSR